MPYKVPMEKGDLFTVKMFATAEQVKKVEEALDEGKKVEFNNSSFSDGGEDFSEVLIDGEVVCTIPGY